MIQIAPSAETLREVFGRKIKNALSHWLRANKLSVFPPEFKTHCVLLSNPVTVGDRRAISCPRSRGAFACAVGGLSPTVHSLMPRRGVLFPVIALLFEVQTILTEKTFCVKRQKQRKNVETFVEYVESSKRCSKLLDKIERMSYFVDTEQLFFLAKNKRTKYRILEMSVF